MNLQNNFGGEAVLVTTTTTFHPGRVSRLCRAAGLGLSLLLAGCQADGLAKRLGHEPGMPPPAPLVCWDETRTEPRPLRLYFLRLDLQDPRLEPCVVLADDPDGAGPAEASLVSPLALAEHCPGLLAAVNANAFDHLDSTTALERQLGWYPGKPVDIEGMAAADSVVRSPPQPERQSLWFDAAGRPHLGAPAAGDPVCLGVADWGDRLLQDGQIVAKPSPAMHPRTLAGFDQSGGWLLLAVVDGRRPGISEGMTLREAAELMRRHGCSEAINLDGGGSSILLLRQPGSSGFDIVNQPSEGHLRPIPVMLGIRDKRKAQETGTRRRNQ